MVKHNEVFVRRSMTGPNIAVNESDSKVATTNAKSAAHECDIFGLVNIGAICWFNSLIQALLSIPKFVAVVNYVASTCPVLDTTSVLAEFREFLNTTEVAKVRDASSILRALMRVVPNFGHQQEDAHQGYYLLLDKLGPAVERIFESLWQIDLFCDLCKELVSQPHELEKMIQVIMERDFIPIESDGDPFVQFLSGHMTFLEGYKCPKCGSIGKAMRIARLVRPPSVLIVSFNKYLGKWENPRYGLNIDVPFMTGPKTIGIAKYELRAIIRHHGSMLGGHYDATGMRSAGPVVFDDVGVNVSLGWIPSIEDYMLFYTQK